MAGIYRRALCAILISFGAIAFGLDFQIDGSGTASTETPKALWPAFDLKAAHDIGNFSILWDLSVSGGGQYGGLFGGDSVFGAMTVSIREGGLSWHGGNFSVQAGRLAMRDEIDSPYSLFLSSRDNPALNVLVRYEDDTFFFSDRWVALNYNSIDQAWPDRSAVIKSYGLKIGDYRVGFQDALVFSDKSLIGAGGSRSRSAVFDPNYFFNPAPGILLQYAASSTDAPWQTRPDLNDNSIMGFFGEMEKGDFRARAQILVDDININRFAKPSGPQNPDKLALALGATLGTDYGVFGFDSAGATKYTFEPYGDDTVNEDYGYTFYPDTQFLLNGEKTAIDPESNYLGYIYGENNLAFRASWASNPGKLSGTANLEFTISGSKSPANPWGNYILWTEGGAGPKFLDDPVLEKKLALSGRAELATGDWILYAEAKAGWAWNRLELVPASGVQSSLTSETDTTMGLNRLNGIAIYYPSGDSGPIGSLTLGAKLAIGK